MATATHSSPSKQNKKKPRQNPESQFHFNLNSCSKSKDLRGAIALYETAVSQNTRVSHHHLNTLLYLCSQAVTDPSTKDLAIEHGFRIFNHMESFCIKPNEASITAVSRLAAAKGDGDYAFELVKRMGKYGITPRLRTYDPALMSFTGSLQADKAYEVEKHMIGVGVIAEEPEIAALLKVSAETGRGERVYGYLQKLRKTVRCVTEDTANIIEDWFRCEKASEVGSLHYNVGLVKDAVSRNGGGWHGLGWLGRGKWHVRRGDVDSSGRCCSCGDQLVCADIEDTETRRFAQSVAGLAMEREVKASFSEFQDWLEKHADYEAIVDGANVGLYQQNFADGGFSVSQLDAVVRDLYNRNEKRWPLVILHSKRLRALLENPTHSKLVEEWMGNGVLYATPPGSNDDWYWIYAAVKLGCLLVTNDEMRDHIFEIVGSRFILRWKERHQVRYTFLKGNLRLQMPPPYSLVIQESGNGSWHVPIAGTSSEESVKTWLCITRPGASDALSLNEPQVDNEIQGSGHASFEKELLKSCDPATVTIHNSKNESQDISHRSITECAATTGKRKKRSPSPSPSQGHLLSN
ncbi:proteinaceous RNase P 2-like isoform X1 [Tripterygium wilfordii]|uniref:proteinaceous RNase P 2-like isoform X1 n=1 Tax=Tripterygium wilfordii TaxID=458696 RepID=UPI0018F81E9F|nr:proteinaceous RNase P 2-like isoform X1 [Tripterygium wilfordii]